MPPPTARLSTSVTSARGRTCTKLTLAEGVKVTRLSYVTVISLIFLGRPGLPGPPGFPGAKGPDGDAGVVGGCVSLRAAFRQIVIALRTTARHREPHLVTEESIQLVSELRSASRQCTKSVF